MFNAFVLLVLAACLLLGLLGRHADTEAEHIPFTRWIGREFLADLARGATVVLRVSDELEELHRRRLHSLQHWR